MRADGRLEDEAHVVGGAVVVEDSAVEPSGINSGKASLARAPRRVLWRAGTRNAANTS